MYGPHVSLSIEDQSPYRAPCGHGGETKLSPSLVALSPPSFLIPLPFPSHLSSSSHFFLFLIFGIGE